MKPYFLLSILSLTLITVSCKKNKGDNNTITTGNVTADSMILYTNGGFTPQPVWKFYKINGQGAWEDTTSLPSVSNPNNFNVQMSATKYGQVKFILNEVPAQLLNENNSQYVNGVNLADCPMRKVTVYINGNTYVWYMEECTDGMPSYVKPFADKVNTVFANLK
ncbi:MAG: hypothetical protein KDC11_06870 [Chitinophagaceae bacterium]|nr:hypothetical protein [Chitinophagaceae bacterium]